MGAVLVTGGSGFVGSHVILALLARGHDVRTTIRSADREAGLRAMLRRGGADPDACIGVRVADLLGDDGWREAASGCDHVMHVASPFPAGAPRDENELIVPAREGTLRVLRAARDAGVRRVVLTSSFAAIGYGHGARARTFTEADWTDPAGADVAPYIKSKTLAERAAWDFIERQGGGMELAVVNPVGIFGPALGPALSSSVAIIKRMMNGMAAVPRIHFGIVDVRDLADLHLRAMTKDDAAGQRLLATGGDTVSMLDVALMARRHLGAAGKRLPRRQSPDWLLRVLSRFKPELRPVVQQLGIRRSASSAKARDRLGWRPRPYAETIADTVDSLLALGIMPAR